MPAIILSDNGVSSGSAGLKTSGSNDGILTFQTTTAGGTATTAVTINTSQNVGVGTTSPSGRLHTVQSNGVNYFESPGISSIALQFVTNSTNRYRIGIPSASNDLQFLAGGTTETMRLDVSGNLGLGVTPSAWNSVYKTLQLGAAASVSGRTDNNRIYIWSNVFVDSTGSIKYINADYAAYYKQQDGQHQWFYAPSGAAGATATMTQAMTLDASGNLGIGTTSPSFASGSGLAVYGASAARLALKSNATGANNGLQMGIDSSGLAFIEQRENNALLFATNATERARIDSSGNLLVGTTSTVNPGGISGSSSFKTTASGTWAGAFENSASSGPWGVGVRFSGSAPNGTSNAFFYGTDTGGDRFFMRSNGGLANYSANNVNLSDERTKTDIQNAGNYLAKICAIPVRTFKYKDQTDDLLNLGCIAQEVEAVAPELVDVSGFGETPEDGVPLKAIYQTDLQYALMKALQELKAEFDAYKLTHP